MAHFPHCSHSFVERQSAKVLADARTSRHFFIRGTRGINGASCVKPIRAEIFIAEQELRLPLLGTCVA